MENQKKFESEKKIAANFEKKGRVGVNCLAPEKNFFQKKQASTSLKKCGGWKIKQFFESAHVWRFDEDVVLEIFKGILDGLLDPLMLTRKKEVKQFF